MELFKGRKVEIGMTVDVYRNLLSKEGYSIRDSKKGVVLCHCRSVSLSSAVFKVSEAGRQKVLTNKRRSVHAFIRGTLQGIDIEVPEGLTQVYYNPYKTRLFLDTDRDEYIETASEVFCIGKFAYAKREELLV